jgi:predicted metalloprotease with PDZ domain
MCIDILMREASNGNRGILSLMKELSNKYGKNKPFEDDKLIAEITEMTYPSVGDFLNTHVVGDFPINYSAFFEKVGLEIGESKIKANYIMMDNAPIVSGDGQKGTIFFTSAALQNSFWAAQGVQENDVIKSIDGTDLTLTNANQVLQEVFMWKPGKDIEVVLDRNGEEIVIKTTTTQGYTTGEGLIEKQDATEAQLALRNAWLKG